jgi:non-heme chloroperoxidase
MPTLQATDGTSVYYEDFGEGCPILFICSGNATHAMWEEQVSVLAESYRTLTFDWRGTGRSDRPRSGYTLEAVVSDVSELISTVLQRPAIVVGHGMGGHVAIRTAYEHPDLVAGLVVVDSGPWYAGERDGIEGGMSRDFVASTGTGSQQSYIDVLTDMTDRLLFHRPVSEPARTAAIMQQLEWPLYVVNRYDDDMRDLDHREYLPSITLPTLIVHGKHDVKQRFSGAAVMEELLPRAQLVIFEDSAHSPQAEETQKFNTTLTDFVQSVANL